MGRRFGAIGCAIAALVASSDAAMAVSWHVTKTLFPGPGYPADGYLFGHDVSISGNNALVSGQLFDVQSGEAGPYIAFTYSGGSISGSRAVVRDTIYDVPSAAPLAKLDLFGHSAIDGDRIVVGVDRPGSPFDPGEAAVFDSATGKRLHDLVSPYQGGYDGFGANVDISGTSAIVGTEGRSVQLAAVFDTESGEVLRTLVGDTFSIGAVSISGDYAAVEAASAAGPQVLIWNYVADSIVQTLNIPVAEGTQFFGVSLDLEGTRLLVGSPSDVTGGHAYIYDRDTGTLLDSLRAGDGDPWFGLDVALSGDRALVGSWDRAYVIAPVPAPAGMVLALTAFCLLSLVGLRRQRAATAATSASGAASAAPRAAR